MLIVVCILARKGAGIKRPYLSFCNKNKYIHKRVISKKIDWSKQCTNKNHESKEDLNCTFSKILGKTYIG